MTTNKTTTTKRTTVALYLRTSTTNGQTVENQRLALHEVAERKGWGIVAEFEDVGVSGAKTRDKRPGLDALLKAAERGQFDLMACWAVDRLGRSMVTAANAMDTLERAGVDQYYHQNGGDVIDGSTPMGKAMIGMSVVFAELERAQIVSRIQAGLDRARAEGKRLGRKPGWRPEKRKAQDEILALHRAGVSVRKIAKTVSVAPGTVQKVVSEHRRA